MRIRQQAFVLSCIGWLFYSAMAKQANASIASSIGMSGVQSTFTMRPWVAMSIEAPDEALDNSQDASINAKVPQIFDYLNVSLNNVDRTFAPEVSWMRDIKAISSDWSAVLPAVVALPSATVEPMSSRSLTDLRQTFWRCPESQSRVNLTGLDEVWVKGCRVAEMPQAQAQLLVETLTRALQAAKLNNLATELNLSVYDGQIVGKLGRQVLFVVTPELAQQQGQPPELLAIDWMNRLRIALGLDRLSLDQAQAQLHRLVETEYAFQGGASWYGPYFHGRITATGETFNQHEMTAAHRTLPFDTYLKVTNLRNGKSVVVRINDRGPYVDEDFRMVDLSYRAAIELGSDESGVVPIKATILQSAPGKLDQVGDTVISKLP